MISLSLNILQYFYLPWTATEKFIANSNKHTNTCQELMKSACASYDPTCITESIIEGIWKESLASEIIIANVILIAVAISFAVVLSHAILIVPAI